MDEQDVLVFITDLERRIVPLYKKMSESYWNATISGKKEDYKKHTEYNSMIQKIFNDKKEFEKIRSFRQLSFKDPIIKRQVDVIYNSFLSAQGDIKLIHEIIKKSSAVEHKFNTFRAKVNGKELTDNELKDILKNETNSTILKAAWEANKRQGELVAEDVIDIVLLRNQLARGCGFKNYYSMALQMGEQDEEQIKEVFNEFEELTNDAYRKLKVDIDRYLSNRCGIQEKDLRPWHYQDPFFQEGPHIYEIDLNQYYRKDILKNVSGFYSSLGMQVEDILSRSDLYEKKGKEQHAYCLDIDRKGDIRVLENIKDDESWADTTLHEFGHALYQKHIDPNLPFFIRDNAHTFVTEAIAMLFGRQSKNIEFIKSFAPITKIQAQKISSKIAELLRLRQLVFARWAMVMRSFESELYENPKQNLNKLWWEIVKRYQYINFTRDKPDWASKIHLVSAPVYYHNYALGEMLASQLHTKITREFTSSTSLKNVNYVGNVAIGDYLKKELFYHGMKYPHEDLVEKATGEPLTSRYFVEEFIGH